MRPLGLMLFMVTACGAATSFRIPELRFEPAAGEFAAHGDSYRISLTRSGCVLTLADRSRTRKAELRTTFAGAASGITLEGLEALPGRANYLQGADSAAWRTDVPAYGKVRYRGVYRGIDLIFYASGGNLEYDFVVAPGAKPSSIALDIAGARSIRIDAQGNLVLDTSAGAARWLKPSIYQVHHGVREPVDGRFELRGRRVGFHIAAYDHSRQLIIDPAISFSSYLGGKANEGARAIAVDSAGNTYVTGFTSSDNLSGTGGSLQPAYAGGTNHFDTGDAFIAKINPQGALVYLTYLGGSGDDFGLGIAVDAAGGAYVAGTTNSPNFRTTPGAYQTAFRGSGGNQFHIGGDAFVAKLNPAGNSLIYSTLLGGTQDESALAVAIDSAGNAYVTGTTLSTNFPTTAGAFQTTNKGFGGNPPLCSGCGNTVNSGDIYVVKLNPAGSQLLFSTLIGGSKDDTPAAIAVDSSGAVFIAGDTKSSDFPVTPGAFQTVFRGSNSDQDEPVFKPGDGFVTKLSATGASLLYSTYLGGSRGDTIFGMAIDASGAAYVTGLTSSLDFPTTASAPQKTYKGPGSLSRDSSFLYGDAFVTKLNPQGSALVYSTYFGGSSDDAGWAIAVDPSGAAYVAGLSNSPDLAVTPDAIQRSFAGGGGQFQPSSGDAFLLKLDPAGATVFCTYLGGNLDDAAAAIALDSAGNGYITGYTLSANFPVTAGAFQRTYGGLDNQANGINGDSFVTKISGLFTTATAPPPSQPPPPPAISIAGVANAASLQTGPVSPGEIVIVSGSGMGPATPLTLTPDPATSRYATSASQARVLFDGFPAPLLVAGDKQSIVIVPYEIAGQTATKVQAEFNGVQSAPITIPVADAAPGLYSADSTGAGPGLIVNEDGTPNSADNPAGPGSVVVLYGTGEGQTDPPGVDGKLALDVPPVPLIGQPGVTVADLPAELIAAGAVPGDVAGRFQVTLRLPDSTPSGVQPVVVTFGQFSTQPNITVAVR